MKKVYIFLIMAFFAVSLSAQNRPVQDRGYMGANPARVAPTLTAEQSEAISALRGELQKELIMINNQLAELRAQLRTLEQVDKPNMRAVNSKIDEITSLQNKRMKVMSANRAKVRELLTDEQRVEYDLKRSGANYRRGAQRNFRYKK